MSRMIATTVLLALVTLVSGRNTSHTTFVGDVTIGDEVMGHVVVCAPTRRVRITNCTFTSLTVVAANQSEQLRHRLFIMLDSSTFGCVTMAGNMSNTAISVTATTIAVNGSDTLPPTASAALLFNGTVTNATSVVISNSTINSVVATTSAVN
jgi:hypothetical protein